MNVAEVKQTTACLLDLHTCGSLDTESDADSDSDSADRPAEDELTTIRESSSDEGHCT